MGFIFRDTLSPAHTELPTIYMATEDMLGPFLMIYIVSRYRGESAG